MTIPLDQCSYADLIKHIERLETQLAQVRQEKVDLELLHETTLSHADTIESQLISLNEQLQAEISERLRAESALKASANELSSLLMMISRDKADLELLLETATEHGDVVESLLHDSEAKYRGIFENAIEGIYQTTLDGHYRTVNLALARIYGYSSPVELIQRLSHFGQALYVDPQERLNFIQVLRSQGIISNFEAKVYRKDGSMIWTSENACVVNNRRGEPLYYVGVIEDITKRKLAESALKAEKEKSERLLLNILPRTVADQLKQNRTVVADKFEQVTILFADIVDFTPLASRIPPTELVNLLNDIFSVFDRLADQYKLEKIKTIGDAYMVAGGIPLEVLNHAQAVANMALDMRAAIQMFKREDGQPFQLRIGIHTGPVVAGVIGLRKFIYDLWGDAVNIASRMESQGKPNGIQVTVETWAQLKDSFEFEERGWISIKGWGDLKTYWLLERKSTL